MTEGADPLPATVQDKIHVEENGCWTWTGAVNPKGYGVAWTGGGKANGRTIIAHRHVYGLLIGPIPLGLDLDHECHNKDRDCRGGAVCLHRRCVNPAHLEPKTRSENLLASRWGERYNQTHCKHGHEFTKENTYEHPNGNRIFRACTQAAGRKWYHGNRKRTENA